MEMEEGNDAILEICDCLKFDEKTLKGLPFLSKFLKLNKVLEVLYFLCLRKNPLLHDIDSFLFCFTNASHSFITILMRGLAHAEKVVLADVLHALQQL